MNHETVIAKTPDYYQEHLPESKWTYHFEVRQNFGTNERPNWQTVKWADTEAECQQWLGVNEPVSTKKELMDWHKQCVRRGFYETAKIVMGALARVLPTQHKDGGYLLYIASYAKEVHASGFAKYVAETFVPHTNIHGDRSYLYSDSGAICTRLVRKN